MATRNVGVFMAFGTLGDVLPIAYVAAAFARSTKNYSIRFVTHSAHQLLTSFLLDYEIRFSGISTSSVLPVNSVQNWLTSDDHMDECLQAIEKAFEGADSFRNFIAINFFALEGWHISELYNVQCFVLAPYVMPYSAPASFERQFERTHPRLYQRLQLASPREVGWKDVMHWMWPLFTDRWTSWRVKKLHLSACPLTDPVTELPVHNWPSAVPVLYGFSGEVVECPDYWPRSVHVCGFWFPPDSARFTAKFPACLSEFLSSATATKPVFIGFSSIGSMGLLRNPTGMVEVIRQALKLANKKGILFTAGYPSLEAAIIKAAGMKSLSLQNEGLLLDDGRLFCYSGYVAYESLFPECSVVVHHGGSGTTAACLRAGVPQIVCPFVLDQFYWSERMFWIGVSPKPLKSSLLIPDDLGEKTDVEGAVNAVVASLMEASCAEMKAQAVRVSNKISTEDGCMKAVEVVHSTSNFV